MESVYLARESGLETEETANYPFFLKTETSFPFLFFLPMAIFVVAWHGIYNIYFVFSEHLPFLIFDGSHRPKLFRFIYLRKNNIG